MLRLILSSLSLCIRASASGLLPSMVIPSTAARTATSASPGVQTRRVSQTHRFAPDVPTWASAQLSSWADLHGVRVDVHFLQIPMSSQRRGWLVPFTSHVCVLREGFVY